MPVIILHDFPKTIFSFINYIELRIIFMLLFVDKEKKIILKYSTSKFKFTK